MRPIALELFVWQIPSYGAAIVVSCILCGIRVLYSTPRDLAATKDILNIFLIILASIFVAAFIVQETGEQTGRLEGDSFSMYPVLVSTIASIWVYSRSQHINWRALLDFLTPYALVALAIQRSMGCFLAGCCYGAPTSLPWGLQFPSSSVPALAHPGAHLHPTQLYYAVTALLIATALIRWRHKELLKNQGDVSVMGFCILSLTYLAIGQFRGDGWHTGSLSGVLAVAVMAWSAWLYLSSRLRKTTSRRIDFVPDEAKRQRK